MQVQNRCSKNTNYSLLSFKIYSIIFDDIRKLVNNNLSIIGFTFLIIDICFAFVITPKEPVVLKFNFAANFRAFRTSNIKITSSNSLANAIALASPLST